MVEASLSARPAISIIMLSYNHGEFMSDAIASALNQNVDLELVVVDDFSTDESRSLSQTWAQKDSRVRVILHERNMGIAATANDGIESARGRYIALASSDDMFKRDSLATVVSLLDSREDIGAAILDAECIDSDNRKLGFRFSDWHGKPPVKEGYFFRYLVKGNFVCTGVVRKSVIEKTGIRFNRALKYVNDWMFWLDLSHSCKFAYLDSPVYRYRIHRSATSTTLTISGGFAADVAVYDMILEKYGRELDPQTKGHILRNMGVNYCLLGDFQKARWCLHLSFKRNRTPITKLMALSLIALSYQMTLFRTYVRLWRHRDPYRILASSRRG